ncbi:invasion associated locus B family protein [Alisedimentitalea sp. MJ-SS2]|uniref:invasion associated locus B family protein n=1 Tax=Aliisedimentitalea sp. MJ-SS2 TaxID=3049795 RepID=UPI00290C26C6|nr:invasion associated locus B family protein [Alisedimentitalea sp. MJ-SS2]MDU8926903.1 invasion associated locus B family protein [Alisedimentitalea sp. MJ-SS2]
MPRFLTTLSLIAALGAGSAVMAQEDTPKPEDNATAEATDSATTDANDPGSDLSMGEDTVPAIPQPYFKEEHGDWKLQCFPVEEGEDPCNLYQLLKDEQGTDVAEAAFFRLPSGGKAVAGATITVPLETLLTAQLTIAIDGAKGKRYPFAFCSPVGCYARIGFTAQDIAAFKKGVSATVTLVPALAPDQKVNLKMSLKGFTAGFNAASVIQN